MAVGEVGRTGRDQRAKRAYNRRLAGAMSLYAVLLVVSITALDSGVGQPWLALVALLPMAPLAYVPVAVLRLLGDLDELQRRVHLEALAIGFGGGSLLTLAYGFAEFAGAPRLSWLWVWPVYAACWIVGSVAARRRYPSRG